MSIVRTTAAAATNATSLTFTATFDSAVTGVDATDFRTAGAGAATGTIASVIGSGKSYTITVGNVTGDGDLQLVLVNDGSIRDSSNNVLNPTLTSPNLVSFAAPSLVPTDSFPYEATVADVNRDGIPDLIVPNFIEQTVTVSLGNGDGTFLAMPDLPTGKNPTQAVVADFNHDGIPDIAVADLGSNAVNVMFGNGDGTFQAPATYKANATPTGLAVGDFNGDGIADLAVTNSGTGTAASPGGISLLFGRPNGTFAPPVTLATGAQPYFIAAQDLNGDGKPDLVTANLYGNSISILFSKGDGTFSTETLGGVGVPGFAKPRSVAFGDFNGDGITDLVFTNKTNGTITVLLGKSDGTFRLAETYPAVSTGYGAATADIDGDGRTDIAVVGETSNSAALFLGNGDGTFRLAKTIATGKFPASVALADLNGDGEPDLVVDNEADSTVGAYLNAGAVDTGYVVDHTPPVATIVSGPPAATALTSATFAFSGMEPTVGGVASGFGSFETSLDGAPFAPTISPIAFTGLTEGSHTFQVRAIDMAGNVSNPISYRWTIDLTAPTATLDSDPQQETNAVSATFDFHGDDPNADGVSSGVNHLEVSVDGGSFKTAASPDTIAGLTDGSHTFQVRAVDNVGNVGPASTLYSWTVDTTPPVVTITSAPPAFSDNAVALFDFFAQDPIFGGVASGIDHLEVRLDGASFTTATSPQTFTGLTTGSHTFQARAVDVAGNVSAIATYTWDVDLTATTETIDVASVALQPSADLTRDNDFTRFADAFANVQPGDVIQIHGTLDWSEPNALASWESAPAGRFSFAMPSVSDITVTAASTGDGILGPGDIATDGGVDISGEGPFRFAGAGPDQRWILENLTIADFDTAIGFAPDGTSHDYDGTKIVNNTITVAGDNDDADWNAGILLAASANQTVQGNTIGLLATGNATDGSVGIGSSRQSTNAWDNLLLDNNTVTVLSNSAENIVGIDEASGSVGSSITVSNNRFLSAAAGNDPTANRQIGFGITSETLSSTSSHPAATVVYSGDVVQGANEGFEWGVPAPAGTSGDPAYDWTSPDYVGIAFTNDSVTNVDEGFFAQFGGKGTFTGTTIANVGTWKFGTAFHARGAGSVLTVSDPTANFTGLASLKNEEAGGLVVFSAVTADIANVSRAEGNYGSTIFSFPVTLDVPLSANQIFTIQFATSSGTADGNDYRSLQGTLTFLPGESMHAISVIVFGDTQVEPDETFYVNLLNPQLITNGAAKTGLLADVSAVGTIVNDDVTNLAVSMASIRQAEGNSGNTPFTFAPTLNAAPASGQYFTVDYATSNGTADGNDFQGTSGTLTFLAGSTTPAGPLTVLVYGDTTVEPDETFFVTLSNPLLRFTSQSSAIPGNIAGSAMQSATILNDDVTLASVSINSASQPEGNSGVSLMNFTISLTGTITSPIKVNYATALAGSGSGYADGNDFQGSSGTVTFMPGGATTLTASVAIYGDKAKEPDEIFDMVLSMPTGQTLYTLGDSIGIGTITNDD